MRRTGSRSASTCRDGSRAARASSSRATRSTS
jgi:hypothetical protein